MIIPMSTIELVLGGIFGVTIITFLIADLGFFNKRAHRIGFKSAAIQSAFWVAISFAFAVLIYYFQGKELALQFTSAYLTEKILSIDNLFVILLIFQYFQIEEAYHHRVLFWGILGAIVMRAIFIGAGSFLISQFHWILYIFGAILVWSGFQMLRSKKDAHADFGNNRILSFLKKHLPLTTRHHVGSFVMHENGKRRFTLLFLALLMIEFSDLIFALDSIPAVFAISQDPFIVFTSNIFAIMGLRAMFFLLEDVIKKFHHLSKALALILIFIGFKMFAGLVDIHISSTFSFTIIIVALLASIVTSLSFPQQKQAH